MKRQRTRAMWENTVLALQTLRDRSYRSFLTMLGVAIGVIIIIGVASVLNGFRQGTIDQIERFGTSNIYVSKFPMFSMTSWWEYRRRKPITLEDAAAIREQCPAVMAVNAELHAHEDDVSAKYRERSFDMPNIVGSFPSIQQTLPTDISQGRYFTDAENQQRMPVCVIGWNIAETLFPHEVAVGKNISLNNKIVRVCGVLAKFGDPNDEDNWQDMNLILPYYTFKQMFPSRWNVSHFITAKARPGRLKMAVDQIEDLMRRRRHVPWKADNDFELNTSSTMIASFDRIVFTTIAVMFALSTVAFIVGGVGVMNVMFASVKERTREIGIRRALGARRRDIVWQFLVEAGVMTGVGGLAGVIIGIAVMRAFEHVLPQMPNNTPVWACVFGFIGSTSVGVLFGLWPAITAARLDPIKALRYE